jgi:hypothetical protein
MTPQIIPSPLAKALGCGVTAPGAFFDDDYLDYVDNLRRDHLNNPPKQLRAKQWIELYPELKDDFTLLLLEKEKRRDVLADQIKQQLKNIMSVDLGVWNLILTEMVYSTAGKKLDNLNKQIRWFKMGLVQINQNDQILTDDQVQEARDFPVEELIETKKINKMWCCPFHEDNTPSFHIYKNNSWHCFGCQAHGNNAVDYIMKKNNLEFVEAVKLLISLC